ncbi:MAG: hypothetical protein K9I59_02170 [Chlorobium sp.]|uniref:hypothetical protein n=1 Tax=Chlorobium sp. TaxID=1095 RepID=UPI001DEEC4B8|nr:hypothetical protein [Chlorobium sp.]MBN1278165.1 hypothetical protein [Chlorobiaceae bacterium]MCF8215660.1 hypothetical protein [Chlorobium sp.]MCF8270715.1 hypothetical protein [Chlorobium sp.]MCF8286869.1 hypothetical protein [Chlorobium sp.]MCF8290555.1 hypothetical protein [Chlorobium sp.]
MIRFVLVVVYAILAIFQAGVAATGQQTVNQLLESNSSTAIQSDEPNKSKEGSRKDSEMPINLLPMYGAPYAVKNAYEKEADEEFIATMTKNGVSRDSAAVISWALGMQALDKKDGETAMKRFNQSWLLDQDGFLSHWGFGQVLFYFRDPKESLGYFEKSLSLFGSKSRQGMKSMKPYLFSDAARAYSTVAILDSLQAPVLKKRADELFDQLLRENPKFREGYTAWLVFSFVNREFRKAWDIVHAARRAGIQDLPKEILKALSDNMSEPNE